MKNIVITGASRGIGRSLALEFLKRGCNIWISGRNPDTLDEAVRSLSAESGNKQVNGIVCDVTRLEEIKELWNRAAEKGPVDIWINNAGINHLNHRFHELEVARISATIDTNLRGTVLGSKVALGGMLNQDSGMIYNMEGFGSDGRIITGMSVYGTTKNAVRYFNRSLVKEYRHSHVKIGSISPGMLVTDMLLEPLRKEPEKNRGALRIFHLLADPTERVAPWIAGKIMANNRHGIHITWLTRRKIAFRMAAGMVKRRKVEGLPDL